MKKLLLLCTVVCTTVSFAQTTAIPDSNFEQALVDQSIDSDGTVNGQIANTDAIGITSLILDSLSISDLTGIEIFTDLLVLDVTFNSLSTINVSQNTALDSLRCPANNLTAIDVSALIGLNVLDVSSNNITTIDLSSNVFLTELRCRDNNLSSIDLSTNTDLYLLDIGQNNLSTVDLNQQIFLEYLFLDQNNMTTSDFSGFTYLNTFNGSWNNFTNLNLSSCPALYYLFCYDCGLQSIDVSTSSTLFYAQLDVNNLSTIDLVGKSNLWQLTANDNPLTSLDPTDCINLNVLYLMNTNLPDINLEQNVALQTLLMSNNPQLEWIKLKNGANTSLSPLFSSCPNLFCIEVDNEVYSETNWVAVDDANVYSEDCALGLVDNEVQLLIYPTVTDGLVYIETDMDGDYQLIATNGTAVSLGQLFTGQNVVDINDLSAGTYILKTRFNEATTSYKLIKI